MTQLKIDNQVVYFKSSENMSEVDDKTVTLTMTSPPYWNLKNYNNNINQIGQKDYQHYLDRMNTVWEECYRVTKDNGVLVININSRRHKKQFYPISLDIYKNMKKWKLIDILIWYVPNALPQPNYYIDKLFDNKFEYLLVFAKNYKYDYTFNKIRVKQKYANKDPRKWKLNPLGRCIGNVIKIPAYRPPNIKKRTYHIAAYPEELVQVILSAYTNEGDTVLDPFLGSGTTLKVSRSFNRVGIGYEISEEYIDIIKDRIQEDWSPAPFERMDILTQNKGSAEKPRRPRKKAEKLIKPDKKDEVENEKEITKVITQEELKYVVELESFENGEKNETTINIFTNKMNDTRILQKIISENKYNVQFIIEDNVIYLRKCTRARNL